MPKPTTRCQRAVAALFFALLALVAMPSTAEAEGKEKAGRWMFNIRLGVAANVGCGSFDCGRGPGPRNFLHRAQFVVSPEIAVALDKGYHAYLGFIPMFQVGDGFTLIVLPLTFQYDIELPIKKVKGLYIYPKVNAGYARGLENNGNYFSLEPTVGLKYQFHEHVHTGVEPLGFMFLIGDENGRSDFNVQYHFLGHIGFDW